MTENMNNELNLENLEQVNGGKGYYGGYRNRPAEKAGYRIYQIQPGDALQRIATHFRTTVDAIMFANRAVRVDPGKIRAGYYLYIPM